MFDRVKSNWIFIAGAALVLLTLFAAVLQYRWINRVSAADRRQRRDFLDTTLRGFSDDFHDTILRLLPFFRPSPVLKDGASLEPYLTDLSTQWRSSSDRPLLLSSVSIGIESDRGAVFKRLATGEKQFQDEAWPDELALYRTILEKRLRMPGGAPPLFPNGFAFELIQGKPALAFPLVVGPLPPEGQPGPGPPQFFPGLIDQMRHGPALHEMQDQRDFLGSLRPAPEGSNHFHELKGWCFLEIDAEYLRKNLLPELVARHYGRNSDYKIAIVATKPFEIVYQSDGTPAIESLSQVDAGIVLFDTNIQPGHPGPPPPDGPHPPNDHRLRPPPPPGPQPFVSGEGGSAVPQIGNLVGQAANAWVLVLKNRSGSLETLLAHSRRHNLALSFGIILLLAGSAVLFMIATARARNLARQQMEFVAGVSHELRTPLTVIQSTSYNLAKGMIQDVGRVKQYGAVIQNEARRLINQIERMLSFAGIQSGRVAYDFRETNVSEILDRALAEYASTFAANGWQVVKTVDENLPAVRADGPAIESAVKNLFENALKYASQGKWLSVSAREAPARKGREVQIIVADNGPGILPKDLPHIFDPFYRGQNTVAEAVTGAGLGLCLVARHLRAHGGRATVQSSQKTGTSFTLHLPALDGSGAENGSSDDV